MIVLQDQKRHKRTFEKKRHSPKNHSDYAPFVHSEFIAGYDKRTVIARMSQIFFPKYDDHSIYSPIYLINALWNEYALCVVISTWEVVYRTTKTIHATPQFTLNVAIVFFSPPKAYMQTVNIRDEIRGSVQNWKHQSAPTFTAPNDFWFCQKECCV